MGLVTRWILILVCALFALCVGSRAEAQLAVTPCALPYTFQNNTFADATQVNANLQALQSCLSLAQGASGIDPRLYGVTCGAGTDNTAPLQTLANLVASNGGGTILIPCQIAIAGTLTLGSSTRLTGVGPIYYHGMAVSPIVWPPTAGPAINCTGPTVPECILVQGTGVEIDHLNLGNPQPTPPGSGTYSPTLYPYIIVTDYTKNWTGFYAHELTFTSASQCIDLEGSPSYTTNGIAGSQFTLQNIWFNPCLNAGLKEHHIDNTGEVDNLEYDYWWQRGNPTVQAYVKAHSVGMIWQYAANTRFNGVEFFSNKIAIDQVNDTVAGGFNLTFAAANIQGVNISFNEVCQAMANESGSALVSSGSFGGNVTLYQDTTAPTINCPLNSSAAIDLSGSGGVHWVMSPMKVGYVQTLAAIGPNSTLDLDHVDIQQYSYFAAGGPAFKVSAGADFSVGSTLMAAIRPASGTCGYGACGAAGAIVAKGLDGTLGSMRPLQTGGGTNCAEGSALVRPSGGNSNSGIIEVYQCPGAPAPGGGGGSPTNRIGYFGYGNSTGINVASDVGKIFIKPNVSDSSAPLVNFGEDGSHNNLINVSPLPTAPPSGVGNLYVCVDNAGNLYVKSACP